MRSLFETSSMRLKLKQIVKILSPYNWVRWKLLWSWLLRLGEGEKWLLLLVREQDARTTYYFLLLAFCPTHFFTSPPLIGRHQNVVSRWIQNKRWWKMMRINKHKYTGVLKLVESHNYFRTRNRAKVWAKKRIYLRGFNYIAIAIGSKLGVKINFSYINNV